MNIEHHNRWYHVGLADLLFCFFLVLIVWTSSNSMVSDPGLGWHLRNVDLIMETGNWLHEDSFTHLRTGQTWYSNQWIGDFLLRAGYAWGGLEGIAITTAIAFALIYQVLYLMLIRDGLPWTVALLWSCLAAVGTSGAWIARPTIATIFGVLIVGRICVLFHEERCARRQTWWLLPFFVIWANTHGGFIAGLIMLAVAAGTEFVVSIFGPDSNYKTRARHRGIQFGGLLAGSILCTFINPYGPQLYPFIFALLGNDYFMNLNVEWLSSNFHLLESRPFELLLLLFATILAFSRYRPSILSFALAIYWLHFALFGIRYIPLWAMVAVPIMARSAMEIPWLKPHLTPMAGDGPRNRTIANRNWLAMIAVILLALVWARVENGFVEIRQEIIAVDACDYLLVHHTDEVVFHDYNWGGYLIWKGWENTPRFKNWIDDRNDVQGEKHTRDYFSIIFAQGNWQQRISDSNISLICVPPGVPLARLLTDSSYRESQNWETIYQDEFAIILALKTRPGGE